MSQFACTLCPLLKGALFLSPARRRHKCQCLDLWVDLRLRHTGPKRPKRRVEAHFFPQIIPWLVHRNLQNPDFMGQKKRSPYNWVVSKSLYTLNNRFFSSKKALAKKGVLTSMFWSEYVFVFFGEGDES